MNLNSKPYEDQYAAAPPGTPAINDAAEKYGATIREAQVPEGQLYWRVIGVHHLLPEENQGAHNIFVEALDEQGARIRQGKAYAASTWEGRQDGPSVSALDKAASDPMGCDFPMGKEATYSVWMRGADRNASDPSDRVEKMHTRHADEGAGNTIGHHSFLVVFQRARKGTATLDEAAVLAEARRLRDALLADDTPFAVYARQHDLGAPITAQFSAGGYQARGYVGGVVYAPLTRPDEIKVMNWPPTIRGVVPAAAAAPGAEFVTVYGIDVSLYQNVIDWRKVASQPTQQGQQVQFAYIKATEGAGIVDPQFVTNWRNSQGLLPRGPYHFFRATADVAGARLQAEHFVDTVRAALAAAGEAGPELPPMVDLESMPAAVTAEQAVAGLQAFLALAEQAFAARPIIYTGGPFWQEYMRDSRAFSQDYLLWIASYGGPRPDGGYDPPSRPPAAPGGWSGFTIWQYAVQTGVPGISTRVDRNQMALPAGTSVVDFLNQACRRPELDDELKRALLERAAAQPCLELARDSRLFQEIVTDRYAPNSPEFTLDFAGATYRAQRAERLDGGGVRVYYVGPAPDGEVRYADRADGGPAAEEPPAALRDALLAAAEARLALPFNKDAGLQRQIAADDCLPISAEFGLQVGGGNYAAQCAEQPATGQVRVYYARDPDWNKVQFVERT